MKYLTKHKETPLMKQYNEIKLKYPNCLILFRVGDFYEMFDEDAVKASKILNIVLTKKSNGASAKKIKMAGFPHHAIENYIPKLIRAGLRIAVCDQLEDARFAKGIVKRGLTELITPGLTYNTNVIDINSNNFLASLYIKKELIGLSFLDISTGEFLATQGSFQYILKLITNFAPKEIIYCKSQNDVLNRLIKDIPKYNLEDWVFHLDYAYEKLITHFKTNSLKGFGIEDLENAIIACGAIMRYLEITENKNIKHINSITKISDDKFVWLDEYTIQNLELITYENKHENVSLLKILDKTKTPMGSRLLRKWILLPLKNQQDIQFRLDSVENFIKNECLLKKTEDILKNFNDLERSAAKLATSRITPRELVSLKNSLKLLEPLKKLLETNLEYFSKQIDVLPNFIEKINAAINEETAPNNFITGNFINNGVSRELDECKKIINESQKFLENFRKEKIQETGITSLKISYNKVFGYYIEVSNTHKSKVPSSWLRKQTLVNAERYITEDLKYHEEIILNSGEKVSVLEKEIYKNLLKCLAIDINKIQKNAKIISDIDCLVSFAAVAIENKYVKPEMENSDLINIIEGRHPVIEKCLRADQFYVPNSTFLNSTTQQIIILTGPNMSGKSALLRQVALITLMAQIGSYVPAKKAIIGIVDKIFSRVGASDNLSKGESTFMVEMNETANILNNLSEKSLIIMDEIGRGTSTYDGIAIAAAIVEYLHEHKFKPRTLFATHYHELNEMAKNLARVQNFHIEVLEKNDNIIFRYKMKLGGSQHSFGINVAKMAGIPFDIVERAQHLMQELASKNFNLAESSISQNRYQLKIFDQNENQKKLAEKIKGINIEKTSPIEALLKLNELKSFFENLSDSL